MSSVINRDYIKDNRTIDLDNPTDDERIFVFHINEGNNEFKVL